MFVRTTTLSRRSVGAVAAVTTALLLAACSSSGGGGGTKVASNAPIKVGYIQALTGAGNVFVADNNAGMNAALSEINKNPPGGHKIQLFRADDGTDPTTATTQCQRLVKQDHVSVIITQEIAAAYAACNNVAKAAGIPIIQNAPGAGTYCASNFFNTGPTNYQSANTLVDFLISKGKKRIYFVGSDAAPAKLSFQIAAKELKAKGGTVAGTSYEPLGASDWSSDLSKIASSHADAVFSAAIGADDVSFHKQFAANPQTSKVTVGDLILLPVLIPVIGAKALAGDYLAASYLPQVQTSASTNFVNLVKQVTGSKTPPFQDAAFLYYSMHMLAQAIKKAGSNVTGSTLTKALQGQSFDGPAGTWTWASNGMTKMPTYIAQVGSTGSINILQTTKTLDPGKCG